METEVLATNLKTATARSTSRRKAAVDRKTARARGIRAVAVLATGAMLVLAAVRGTTAQEAHGTSATPAASNAPATQPAGNLVADGVDGSGSVHLTINKSQVVTTKVPYKRVSVGNPAIADVNPIGPGNILVTAKAAGNTQLIIWDDADHSQVVDISVNGDMKGLNDHLHAMFPNSNIEVAQLNGAIALRGRVPSLEIAEQAAALAGPYSPKVLNLMEVSGGQQVMLQVRIAEVSRSAVSQLGINGNYISGAFLGGSNIGQVNPSNRMLDSGLVGATPPMNGVGLNGATPVNPSVTLYGAGQIGNFYLEYFIQALRSNNLLRMLAEPNLIAISGQEAKFLAGGEFPVPVTQGGSSGGVAVTVEYRKFGVQLKFVPVVMGDGRIRLKVAPEVSDLDFTTAVRFNGYTVPGLTSRQVETTIELADGQTFAIAGLLNNTVTAQKDVTPLLGDLPIIGALFRSVRYQRKETELVVLVTPRLVEAMNPAQVPGAPGEKWRHPTENELFWSRDLGGDMADERRPKMNSKKQMAIKNADGTEQTVTATDNSGNKAPEVADDEDDQSPAQRFRGSWGFAPVSNGNVPANGNEPTGTTNPNGTSATSNNSPNEPTEPTAPMTPENSTPAMPNEPVNGTASTHDEPSASASEPKHQNEMPPAQSPTHSPNETPAQTNASATVRGKDD